MPTPDELKQRVASEIDRRRDELVELSLRIHANPEIAFQERQASGWLADYLEANGFQVERGICEIETAFRATFGQGEPKVAFVAGPPSPLKPASPVPAMVEIRPVSASILRMQWFQLSAMYRSPFLVTAQLCMPLNVASRARPPSPL